MKLKQVKDFTQETVTPEIAAKICSLVGWNHLNDDKFKSQGFEITESYHITNGKGGNTYTTEDRYDEMLKEEKYKDYYKELTHVIIKPLCGVKERFLISRNGNAYCKGFTNKGDWTSSDPYTGNTYATEDKTYNSTQGRQVELIQYYLEAGFYIIEN